MSVLCALTRVPLVLANRIDPQTGKVLASFSGVALSGFDQAGGATFTDSLIPGKRVLLAMHQAAADSAVAYDLDPVYQTDLPWITPDSTMGTIGVGSTLPLSVTFQSDQVGVLQADLLFGNDTPYDPPTIPVTFTVSRQWRPVPGALPQPRSSPSPRPASCRTKPPAFRKVHSATAGQRHAVPGRKRGSAPFGCSSKSSSPGGSSQGDPGPDYHDPYPAPHPPIA